MSGSSVSQTAGLARSGGFSLVEAVVAAGLLVTVLASLAPLVGLAVRVNLAAGDVTRATVLAADKVEVLRVAPVPSVSSGPAVEYLDATGVVAGATPNAGPPAYARRWWVEPLPGAPGEAVAIVVVVSRFRLGNAAGGAESGDGAVLASLVTIRSQGVR